MRLERAYYGLLASACTSLGGQCQRVKIGRRPVYQNADPRGSRYGISYLWHEQHATYEYADSGAISPGSLRTMVASAQLLR